MKKDEKAEQTHDVSIITSLQSQLYVLFLDILNGLNTRKYISSFEGNETFISVVVLSISFLLGRCWVELQMGIGKFQLKKNLLICLHLEPILVDINLCVCHLGYIRLVRCSSMKEEKLLLAWKVCPIYRLILQWVTTALY